MLMLSHRGLWADPAHRNTLAAFEWSFAAGFGVELDVRDADGRLVVSHDPARSPSVALDEFLSLYRDQGRGLPVAMNIKSCGLSGQLARQLTAAGLSHYFVFDMAVPDALDYIARGMRVFTRQSEFEPTPSFYDEAQGVWLDGFKSDWIAEQTVAEHLRAGKKVALVSPELHGREAEPIWRRYAGMACAHTDDVLLCTDHPVQAQRWFERAH